MAGPIPRTHHNPNFETEHPVAAALREAGFIPLPRLWVKPYDIPKIHAIANAHKDAVQEIRHSVREKQKQGPDPVTDKDAAWAAYEKANKAR